jgi:NUMOD3 motif
MTEKEDPKDDLIPCGCGCHGLMTRYTKKGNIRKFLPYHNFRRPIHLGRKLTPEHRKKISDSEKGDKHHNYKGGRTKHTQGYMRRLVYSNRRDNRVLEHRLLYEQYHNCCLLKWADVHHKNRIKTDNSMENLEGLMKRDHKSKHKKDMSDRRCSICGKISKYYYRGSQVWYKNPSDKSKFICPACYKNITRKR